MDEGKVDKILQWPVPCSTTEMRAFLGNVRYISTFLPTLADHMRVLKPLITKESQKNPPPWTVEHQLTFNTIKSLVVGHKCLTVIDHQNPADNKICNTGNWRTGATLSWGKLGKVFVLSHAIHYSSRVLKRTTQYMGRSCCQLFTL